MFCHGWHVFDAIAKGDDVPLRKTLTDKLTHKDILMSNHVLRTEFCITKFTDPLQNGIGPLLIMSVPIQDAANIIHSLQDELSDHNGRNNPHNAVATFLVHRARTTAPSQNNETESPLFEEK